MRPHGSPSFLEQRRLNAIALLKKGLTPVEIARKIGVDRRSVRRWKSRFLRQGQKGIKARPASGRPTKLNVLSRKKLEACLVRGAHDSGYSTDLWTCPRVAKIIERQFHVRYHVDHIGRLLRSMGWSPQKPERLARERDEKAIRRWVKQEWPDIKKKPAD